MSTLLHLRGVQAGYGKLIAVKDIDLTLKRGNIVAIVGPNGAGKTTLLNAIMGILWSRGEMTFDGKSLANLDIEERVSAGLSLVPERRDLFSEMSVADNLVLGAYARPRNARERRESLDEVYALFPRLRERHAQHASTLSGGERQMLALGRALMAKPTLLMLDEPSLGLAPLLVKDTLETVTRLRSLGVSILLVEQNARAALAICDYGYVLENGAISLHGEGQKLLHDERLRETYFGNVGN